MTVPVPAPLPGGEPKIEDAARTFPWQMLVLALGTIAATGTGGGVMFSHRSVSSDVALMTSKLDEVLKGQKDLELKFAKLEGRDLEGTLRDHDARLRSVEAALAELRGRGEKR